MEDSSFRPLSGIRVIKLEEYLEDVPIARADVSVPSRG